MNRTMIVIPTYVRNDEQLELTRNAIDSVYATTREDDIALLVVDDGSPEHYAELIGDMLWRDGSFAPQSENKGFSAAVNVGLDICRKRECYPDVVLMNADVRLTHMGWLEDFRDSQWDVAGAKLLYPNGLIQHAGVYFSVLTRDFDHIYRFAPWNLGAAMHPRRCPVTAALMYIRGGVLEEIGLYDEQFPLGWEDVDFCWRALKAGWAVGYEPTVSAIHHEQAFREHGRDPEIAERMWKSWCYLWQKHAGDSFAGLIPTMLEEGEGWIGTTSSAS